MRSRTATRQPGGEIGLDRVHDGVTGARPPWFGNQLLQIARIRHVPEFDQHRRHVGSLENPETGRLQRMLVHVRRGAHVLHHVAGESGRKGFRLPLGEIDENIGDLVRFVGEIDAATRTNVIPDAVGGTTVSCEVLGSFQAHGKIDDLANTGNYLEIDIPSITPAASESAPAQGAISFSGPWTAGNAFSGNCDFYFTPGTPETVDTGKIWVTFTCPGLQSGLSTCPLQIGYAIFENCLTE